ncbi:MAG: glycerol kinase [Candidatus Omnitrophota bacterium]|jgi:glycerol kinase
MPKNKANQYILALDCGTTGNRAIIFDSKLRIKAQAYQEFTQYFPESGWVEHDAEEIWLSVKKVIKAALKKCPQNKLTSMGITNQRETLVIWDKQTGQPAMRAIVWQCRRTTDLCMRMKKKGLDKKLHQKTGLFLDPYFSGSKIKWAVEKYPKLKQGLQSGRLLLGTIDTWIIWKLTQGQSYVTDPTNASRTLLFDIHKGAWDKDLCRLFKAPIKYLPSVLPSCGIFGKTSKKTIGIELIIAGVAGDQQAAAFAQGCSPQGVVKNTYGTGLFVMADTGFRAKIAPDLVTTIAASDNKRLKYAIEGSVFVGGSAIQWLRDGLQIIQSASQSESIAKQLPDNQDLYFVPALAGLGCPHWDPNARGLLIGMTRRTNQAHVVRAALESMAYQTRDVLEVLNRKLKLPIKRLRVDGGAAANNWLMQFQADVLGCEVERPKIIETTALGAVALAGIASGVWKDQKDFLTHIKIDKVFKPKMTATQRNRLYAKWTEAVKRSLNWA